MNKPRTRMRRTLLRILPMVLLLSLVLFAYPVWRLGQWLGAPDQLNAAITLPLFLSQFIARLGLRHRTGRIAYALRSGADFFLGLSPVLLGLVLLGELLLFSSQLQTQTVAISVLALATIAALWGLWKAWHPELVPVTLSSSKLDRPWRFAQISDVHIGSRTARFLTQVIKRINRQNVDFLCITGDFIDQPGVSIDKLQALRSFQGPIYYCIGNHERYEDLEQIIDRLESLGVEVLRNRSLETQGLQIIGIDDSESAEQVARVLPFIEVKDNCYVILLYHRPQGLDAAHRQNIDLMLSGHTHAGQIMPFNLAVNRVFEYTSGLYRMGDSVMYVNEGTGTWGPTLRLGTRSEITLFEVTPETTPREGDRALSAA